MSTDENVLVFPANLLSGLDVGFITIKESDFDYIFNGSNICSRPRSQVEHDESYKQICTYCIVNYKVNMRGQRVFSYFRGKSGGEPRLMAKRSIGVGGHVSGIPEGKYVDWHFGQLYNYVKDNMFREIDEELIINFSWNNLSLIGFLNDDSDPVGKVHFGFVYQLDIFDPVVLSAEDCLRDGTMRLVKDIKATCDQYESWSQILINSIL